MSEQEFSLQDIETLKRLLSRPLILPPDFKSWLYKFASTDAAPYFQELLGVQSRAWRVADPVPTLETCSSTSYVDLATVGPQLTGLEDGTYMVMFGFYSQDGTATTRLVSVYYNDDTSSPPVTPPTPTVITRRVQGAGNSNVLYGFSTTGLFVGMDVTGPNNTNGNAIFRPGTKIAAINSGTQVTLTLATYNVTFWDGGAPPGTVNTTFTGIPVLLRTDPAPTPGPSPECGIVTEGQGTLFHLVTLGSNNNNKIKMRYRVSNGNANFSRRWLHAVQVEL